MEVVTVSYYNRLSFLEFNRMSENGRHPYNEWLSDNYMVNFQFMGQTMRNATQALLYAKYDFDGNQVACNEIMRLETPTELIEYTSGQTVVNLIGWENIEYQVRRNVMIAKFSNNAELRLMLTRGGKNMFIVCINPNDIINGCVVNADGSVTGSNNHGRVLEDVRDVL